MIYRILGQEENGVSWLFVVIFIWGDGTEWIGHFECPIDQEPLSYVDSNLALISQSLKDRTGVAIEPALFLEKYRAWALEQVNQLAADREGELDNLVSGSLVRMVMLNTEIVAYVQAGRPATPSPAVYLISAAIATRRGVALRDTLETLFTRWRSVQAEIATVIVELDRLTEEVEAAVSVEEIEAVLAGLGG